MNNLLAPICCGNPSREIIISPSLKYWFCDECKEEPGVTKPAAMNMRNSSVASHQNDEDKLLEEFERLISYDLVTDSYTLRGHFYHVSQEWLSNQGFNGIKAYIKRYIGSMHPRQIEKELTDLANLIGARNGSIVSQMQPRNQTGSQRRQYGSSYIISRQAYLDALSLDLTPGQE